MTLDKMAFFVYVIRTGSISAAARKFRVSVSAGSRWLQDLEQQFGMTLCRRSNRLLTPTPAGQKLFDEFSPLLDNAETLCQQMQGFQQHDKGHLNIACTPVYANHFLMPLVSQYMQQHPDVTFNINVTPWALDHTGDSDLIISANANYQGYREKDLPLVRRELMQAPFVLVASPAYLERQVRPESPQDLANHQCLFATSLTGSNDWIFRQDNHELLVKIPKSLEINDSDLLLKSVLQGAGIAYLPEFVVAPALARGELEVLLEEYETSTWSLNLFYHAISTASAVALKFKDFLLERQGVPGQLDT